MTFALNLSILIIYNRMEILKADVKLSETVNFFEPIEESEGEEGKDSPIDKAKSKGLGGYKENVFSAPPEKATNEFLDDDPINDFRLDLS